MGGKEEGDCFKFGCGLFIGSRLRYGVGGGRGEIDYGQIVRLYVKCLRYYG